MNPWIAGLFGFLAGACVGAGLAVYGLSWVLALSRTELPPEVAKRVAERAEASQWN